MRSLFAMFAFAMFALTLVGLSVRGGDDHAKKLAPFLDDQTFVVAHIDVAKLDILAIAKHLETLGAGPPEKIKAMAQLVKATLDTSGTKDVYLVMNWAHSIEEVLVVVPSAKKGAAPAAPALIAQTLGYRVKMTDEALLAGPQRLIDRLEKFRPAAVPELAKAFAAVGDGTLRVVFLPPPALRRALIEVFPELPKEVGGGKTAALEPRWAALRVDLGDKPGAQLIVQGADAKSAEEIARALERALEFAARADEVQRDFVDLVKVLPLLKPRVEEGRVVVTLNEKDMVAVVLPLLTKQRAAAQRAVSVNHLKQIGIALHNFHDVNKAFPAASTYDAKGKPLLSWRVHILPYLDQAALHREFRLDEAWDSPHNKALIAKMPAVYSPDHKNLEAGKTPYLGPVGPKSFFGGKKGMSMRQITDGTSNTIMIVEADDSRAAIWTKPDDFKIDAKDPLAGLVRPGSNGFNVAFGDGSVRFLPRSIEPATLRALFTVSGGEVVDVP